MTSVFQKHGNSYFEVLTKYSCESLDLSNSLLEVIFCSLTELAWCEATRMVPLYDCDSLPCSRKLKSLAEVLLEVEGA